MITYMTYSKSGLHLTEGFESCKLKSYQDSGGVWTIGFGHTCGVLPGQTCTQLQACIWLLKDVQRTEAAVNALVLCPLTQGEFDALVDFAFNVGVEAFKKSTMLQLLNVTNYQGAANEFDKWDHIHARFCAGLLRRREAERELFETDLTHGGKTT